VTVFLLITLIALGQDTAEPVAPPHGLDFDYDAWYDDVDCGPLDPDRYPGAEEVCNYVDDDCDGEIDEDVCKGCGKSGAYSDGLGLTGLLIGPFWLLRRKRD